jgi:hypothetical protein
MPCMEHHDYGSFEILVDAGRWFIVDEGGATMASGAGGKEDAVAWMARILLWLVDAMKRQKRGPLQ